MESIQNTDLLEICSLLQQYICALQSVKNGIPNFRALLDTLLRYQENVYRSASTRTQSDVSKFLLSSVGCGKMELDSFHRYRDAIADQVALGDRKQETHLCFHTDASDAFCTSIFTKLQKADVTHPQKRKAE